MKIFGDKFKKKSTGLYLKVVIYFTLFGVIASCWGYKTTNVVYPFPRPDSISMQFLPGTVTSNVLDFNLAYSPDGKSFYFGRSEQGKWVLFVTTFDGNAWNKPVHPAFNDLRYSEADPVFAQDGALYFISSRPRDQTDTIDDYDIWRVKPIDEGRWSESENMSAINSDSNEFYISFAPGGNLYFSSARQGGYGEEDLYVSEYYDGKYGSPINLGSSVNSKGSDHDPLIVGNEKYLIFSSPGRSDSYGQADLYFSKRINKSKWSSAGNLGKRFNTPTYEYCPYLSPDNKYFFYSSEYDVKWINSDYLFKDMNDKENK
ncbi:MAG: hypothetical protein HOP08_08270 [Cyclobacteriaceae bacterium]|nr:hypothetical protein [Cyclobacteriaceae bacterium]